MKNKFLVLALLASTTLAKAQQKTENLIVVTLDGMRWEEVFGGVDSALMNNPKFTQDKNGVKNTFWNDDVVERRKKLFPFLWSTINNEGQLYGNRKIGNNVNNANPYKFSYPGYNEIFTGYPDTAVNSNDKIWNKNINTLEFINQQKGYEGKIAAFSTWDVIPYILNNKRNGIYVNADLDSLKFKTPQLSLINDMQFLTANPIGSRLDAYTYFAGREYLKAYKPKVLYIAFDETDDYAHAGSYDQYLKSAHAEDAMIRDLWNTIQSMPEYKNKTTLIVTCDHGRGDIKKENWQHHGQNIEDAGQIWIAAIGPDTKPTGEVKITQTLYQKQLAATFSALLGFKFTEKEAQHPVGEPITTIYTK